ncbi:hypothetical protein D4764_03G0009300 [Takifugu flavidus]|uniref:Uncharacterized protein n=1 Tax=Takifugu flavidus TaxID=433684 RepID=A0A5C6N8W0_9TELE|nr:hypothetical protein D4764_03G0009300 [Takifugu flavidus]
MFGRRIGSSHLTVSERHRVPVKGTDDAKERSNHTKEVQEKPDRQLNRKQRPEELSNFTFSLQNMVAVTLGSFIAVFHLCLVQLGHGGAYFGRNQPPQPLPQYNDGFPQQPFKGNEMPRDRLFPEGLRVHLLLVLLEKFLLRDHQESLGYQVLKGTQELENLACRDIQENLVDLVYQDQKVNLALVAVKDQLVLWGLLGLQAPLDSQGFQNQELLGFLGSLASGESLVKRVHLDLLEMWAFLGLVNLAEMDFRDNQEYLENLVHLENQG